MLTQRDAPAGQILLREHYSRRLIGCKEKFKKRQYNFEIHKNRPAKVRAGNGLRNRLAPELREKKLRADFDSQKEQNHNNCGADDLASVFDGQAGTQIVA